MIGLALMAWKLAQYQTRHSIVGWPLRREVCAWGTFRNPHAEYYRIIDRFSRGEKP